MGMGLVPSNLLDREGILRVLCFLLVTFNLHNHQVNSAEKTGEFSANQVWKRILKSRQPGFDVDEGIVMLWTNSSLLKQYRGNLNKKVVADIVTNLYVIFVCGFFLVSLFGNHIVVFSWWHWRLIILYFIFGWKIGKIRPKIMHNMFFLGWVENTNCSILWPQKHVSRLSHGPNDYGMFLE